MPVMLDRRGYMESARVWCVNHGEMVLLCNESTHWILTYSFPHETGSDDMVEEIKAFYYGDAAEGPHGEASDEFKAVYRQALEEMVKEALAR